jgi:uncharacterized lipoprotein YddW (UPF0748 family)
MKLNLIGFKHILVAILTLCLFVTNISIVESKEAGQYVQQAEILKGLGLFLGTEKGFELTRASSRAEAAVMLVRLLGEEQRAVQESNSHPFIDVPIWASSYVGYLYKQGLTVGISNNNYGSNLLISPSEYTTFLLRALGYSDIQGDFQWNQSMDFAYEKQLLSQQEVSTLSQLKASDGLLRDYMVKMSYNSLLTNKKGTTQSLYEYLYEIGAIGSNSPIEGVESSEMRAVWISYLDLQPMLRGSEEEVFRTSVKEMYQNIKNMGLNTAIVQVRPFGDAFYPSEYFPWSYIITGEEGKNPGYDPFKILVEEGHNQGLKVEAWLNPYRIRGAGSSIALSLDNRASQWMNDGSNRIIQIPQGTFYNPGSLEVRELIIQGVLEIINNYEVDGIHFDDYFYPSVDLSYDQSDYNEYKSLGGTLSQGDWRRENVNELVQGVYKAIKAMDNSIEFGISPRSDVKQNYDELFIDLKKWVNEEGYVDYIAPQVYYGFNHSKYPYEQVIQEWNEIMKNSTVKLYIGLAFYKIGSDDIWAGSGLQEWVTDQELMKRMIETARMKENYDGFILFRYQSIWKPSQIVKGMVDAEMKSLESLLR